MAVRLGQAARAVDPCRLLSTHTGSALSKRTLRPHLRLDLCCLPLPVFEIADDRPHSAASRQAGVNLRRPLAFLPSTSRPPKARMMKAVFSTKAGHTLGDHPVPVPGVGEVQIRNVFVAANPKVGRALITGGIERGADK